MTDYELAALFIEYFAAIQSSLINFVSVVIAFIVAGYLIASKLQSSMVFILVTIFSAFCIDSILQILFINMDLQSVQGLMADRIATGQSDLIFHSGARGVWANNAWVFGAIRMVATLGAYVGAVAFFFYQRRIGQRHDESS